MSILKSLGRNYRSYSLPKFENNIISDAPRHLSEPSATTNEIDRDEKERKVFNIIKRIPVVGLVYRAGRAIVYKIKNDDEEVTYSLTVDIANLNPIRIVNEIFRATQNTAHNYDEGVWIGKRSLGKHKIGLTIKPHTDLWHYAIMIRGIVYHVHGATEFVKIQESEDKNLKKGFEWTFIADSNHILKSNDEIKNEIKVFEFHRYDYLPTWEDEANCQTFVSHLLSFVTGWEVEFRETKLKKKLGTFFL